MRRECEKHPLRGRIALAFPILYSTFYEIKEILSIGKNLPPSPNITKVATSNIFEHHETLYIYIYIYLLTRRLEQDMKQGQFLSGV